MTTTREALKELANLTTEAGSNYYRRVKLADQIIRDKDWIEAEFRGDDYLAAETLEQQYFHDLSGSLSIWQLLEVYNKFTSETDWKSRKYNLRILWKDTNVKVPVERKVKRIGKAEHEAVCLTLKETEWKLKTSEKKKSEAETELVSLRKKVQQLERENERLKGRVEELERIVQRRLVG